MKHIRLILSVFVIALSMVFTSLSPALAKEAESGSGSSGSGSSGSGSSSTEASETDSSGQKAAELAQKKDAAVESETEKKVQAQAKIDEAKLRLANKKEQTQEQRAKVCQDKKQGLEKKFDNFSANAKRHKAKFDEALAKAVTYQTKNNLATADLNALVTAAQAAGSQAESSIAVLATVTPSVDCNKTTVASDVAKYKAAVDQAKTDLNSYKTSIKTLIQALKKATPEKSETTQ